MSNFKKSIVNDELDILIIANEIELFCLYLDDIITNFYDKYLDFRCILNNRYKQILYSIKGYNFDKITNNYSKIYITDTFGVLFLCLYP